MFESFFAENYGAAVACFFTFAIVVGVLATLVTKFAVTIKDKAELPDGVIGGILIGAITSVPEFITAIGYTINAATIGPEYGNPGAVFGDVIGSNMFCMLIIGVACLATVWIFRHREADQINTITIICLIVGSVLCMLAVLFDNNGLIYGKNSPTGKISPVVWHGFNLFSIFIFLSYAIAVLFMFVGGKIKPAAVIGKGMKTTTKLPDKQMKAASAFMKLDMAPLILLLILGIAVLTFSSLMLAGSCSGCIVKWFPGDATFGRTLLLGVATSLPELIAVATLAIDNRYNMMINSMAGSCAFNMTILFACNVAYACLWHEGLEPMFPMPKDQNSVMVQVVMFILMCVFFSLYLILNSKSIKGKLRRNQIIATNVSLLTIVIGCYLTYMILGLVQNTSV